jgi:hypothetical protein
MPTACTKQASQRLVRQAEPNRYRSMSCTPSHGGGSCRHRAKAKGGDIPGHRQPERRSVSAVIFQRGGPVIVPRRHAPGEPRDDTDVDRLAMGTLAALQGGLLLTQAKRDVGPLEAALWLSPGRDAGG